MFEEYKDRITENRAYLIGVELPGEEDEAVLLEELEELVKTVGYEVVKKKRIKVRQAHARYLIGSGKAEEILEEMEELGCDVLIFDNELSPAQQRNLEALMGRAVEDRQSIILEIFGQRAQTREAVLQVDLARQEYYLPRLKRAWTHLSRQKGGGAMARGMGEKQIEMDERLVRDRIAKLKRELAEVVKQRSTQRKRRERVPLPTAAIVGYTNAGKSSLLNCLTGAEVLAEDKLFATLDPTTRKLQLPSGQILLVTDTVGFVRKLPHRLIEAFKATLEEATYGDFLIHVVDITSNDIEKHMATTMQVMKELGAHKKQIITVFNKIDSPEINHVTVAQMRAKYPKSLFISAKTGEGVEDLLKAIELSLAENSDLVELLIPHDRYDLINKLHEMGAVKSEKALAKGVKIIGNIPARLLQEVESFKRK